MSPFPPFSHSRGPFPSGSSDALCPPDEPTGTPDHSCPADRGRCMNHRGGLQGLSHRRCARLKALGLWGPVHRGRPDPSARGVALPQTAGRSPGARKGGGATRTRPCVLWRGGQCTQGQGAAAGTPAHHVRRAAAPSTTAACARAPPAPPRWPQGALHPRGRAVPDWPLASAGSDMIGWIRVLLSHTLDAARSY